MKITIVTTTIYLPTFLKAYAENAKKFGHDNVDFIVIGDRKTPEGARAVCESIENCRYYDLNEQATYLDNKGHTDLGCHLPMDSIARRNVGHLMAYENGATSIIMLDDDNLATEYDFVKHHSKAGMRCGLPSYEGSNGWYNVCDALQEKNGVEFYARGFPPSKRWEKSEIIKFSHYGKVAVNAGLWTNDPDIDALTRLERRLITTGFKENVHTEFALYPGTWSPWNCQNTAISRAALPSYFLSPHTGRHLDIWASYITTKIAEAMGEVIAFGTPLAFHDRSPHNLYKDLEAELPWIRMTDDFVEALRKTKITSTRFRGEYTGALKEVIEGLREHWNTSDPVKEKYLKGLEIWNNIFINLGA